ncbi:MAG: helix-turn-helix transcriptional regulator [Lachnospiraceae bacterium]|nr:helix-turn-helix transcriptional regulator [Lachnospiraceae bacterium]
MEQEYMERMGRFICQKRKEKGLTQKELATRLGVTDKAVSKWERGNCCPDIALLLPLAEYLGVSTGELLGQEKPLEMEAEEDMEKSVSLEVQKEKAVGLQTRKADGAAKFSKREKLWTERTKNRILQGLSVMCLLAMLICLLCDFIVTGGLGWSYVVCCSVLFGWALLLPVLNSREGACRKALLLLSVLILPYLAALAMILGETQVLRVGVPVALLSVLGIWCLYFVFWKLKNRIFYAWAVAFVVMEALGFMIDITIEVLLGENSWNGEKNMLHVLVSLLLAVFFAGVGYWRDRGSLEA